ncbi:MAG: 16S rRNA (cytidine(1402)-2'-O)-methyltransferase [Chloroflexota bacterium]|nr:16S rRNA (cytidine(1402)-2'-O)-methyltransferase [Dehalococcoidia bacterium]MDW8252455.1 16S rRNA (cytidine(1402)-2'-O)-methyltransferase [Chloroflexota bacterium]
MTLYLVATPIGNLEDITLRALRILREVPLIAAEDTRRARVLLQHYGIPTPVTSYHDVNKRSKLPALLAKLREGDLALISEAGMPAINDPGYELVAAAAAAGIPVVPIPGPSAPIAALAVSGLPSDRFVYEGFLPRKAGERRQALRALARERRTIVLLEAPHRLRDSLTDLLAELGNRPIAVCRELTKLHEEIYRGDVAGALAHFTAPRGEFVLVLAGASSAAPDIPLDDQIAAGLAAGIPPARLAAALAAASGARRQEVYRAILAQSPGTGSQHKTEAADPTENRRSIR